MESHGPLGTLWVALGLGAFYIALTWINVLLGIFLTPLFIIPMTWLQDRLGIGVPKSREQQHREQQHREQQHREQQHRTRPGR